MVIDGPTRRCYTRMITNHGYHMTRGRLFFMIGVLTHHWARADKIEEARKLLDGNGEAQSRAPGFVSRETMISLSDPSKITTLVLWDSNDIYDAWRASPERAAAMSGADAMWSQPAESERFEVMR